MNSQVYKTVFQHDFNYKPFPADKKVILCRYAGKHKLLQGKSEWEDIISESTVLGLNMKHLSIQTFTKSIFSTDYMKITFWAYWKVGDSPVWVRIQAVLKTYFIASHPHVSHEVIGSRKWTRTTEQSQCSPLQTVVKGCVTHFNASHTDVQAGFNYFSHAWAQLHIPAPI